MAVSRFLFLAAMLTTFFLTATAAITGTLKVIVGRYCQEVILVRLSPKNRDFLDRCKDRYFWVIIINHIIVLTLLPYISYHATKFC